MNDYFTKLANLVSNHSSFPFHRKTNKGERIMEDEYETGEYKN